MSGLIYLDNAATSHPKPEAVYRAVDHFLREVAASPGRSSHRLGLAAGRVILQCREGLARLFNAPDTGRVIFAPSCTEALNLAIKGLLRPGDHVAASGIEHNSVMRPLRRLEARGGVELTVVPCSPEGLLDPAALRERLRPHTRLVVLSHASNVTGAIQPVAEAAELAHASGARLLVDAAQSAGALPIDVNLLGIDLLAFSGHKGLLGPQGTGGLVIGKDVDLEPLVEGGTGSGSQRETQPIHLPNRYESGTLNGPGLAGLGAGVDYVSAAGVEAMGDILRELTALLIEELDRTPGAEVYGPRDLRRRTAVVSFTLEGMDVGEAGRMLDERYGFLTRPGLQCSPAAHGTLGTLDRTGGTVRVSPGPFNRPEEIRHFGEALREIQRERI